MSVHVISWVLRNSEATLGDRLVLLVLADHADSEGHNTYPSVATIATEARMSERAVQYSLRRLEEDGRIRRAGQSPLRTNAYQILMGANSAPVQHPAPKPSLTTATGTTAGKSTTNLSASENVSGASSEIDPWALEPWELRQPGEP